MGMTTNQSTTDDELKQFNKMVDALEQTSTWNENPDMVKIVEDLRTNPSDAAQAVRDIMWRMADAELSESQRQRLGIERPSAT